MRRALALAQTPGVPRGPNPRVGAVLLGADGSELAHGYHKGAGTPHAEVMALSVAVAHNIDVRGATAVVTLEPCNHIGRTGPCSVALREAGIARVVFAQGDPNPVAAGGAVALRAAGIDVAEGLLRDEARDLNEVWTFSVDHGRPFITWKVASTLDGRIAAADGTARWITSQEARADGHLLRASVDAVAVGIGTVLVDDPHLAVRDFADVRTAAHQPLRVVVGMRDIPAASRICDDSAPTLHLRLHDPHEIAAALYALDVQHLLVEGGPTVAAAFVRAGLIDAVQWYVAPALLGAGLSALGDAGMNSIADALRLSVTDVRLVGPDVRIKALVIRATVES